MIIKLITLSNIATLKNECHKFIDYIRFVLFYYHLVHIRTFKSTKPWKLDAFANRLNCP